MVASVAASVMDSPSLSITRGSNGCRNAEYESVSACASASATAPPPTAAAAGRAAAACVQVDGAASSSL